MTIIKGILGNVWKKGEDNPKAKSLESTGKGETIDYVDNADLKGSGFYGIRSYIDQFYELRSPSRDSDEFEGLLPPEKARRNIVYVCRAAFVIGIAFFLMGAVAIMVGYLWPHPTVTEATPDSGSAIIEDLKMLKTWKIVGLIVFAFGGFVVAVSLLIPICCRLRWDLAVQREPPTAAIRIYPKISESASSPKNFSPIQKGIPVMEDLQPVQPAQDPDYRNITDQDLLIDS